jgi:hypothetical protein
LRSLREDLCACLLLGASALFLLGCGSGEASPKTGADRRAPAAKPANRTRAVTASGCGLGALLHDLDTLESRLAAGLSYEQYFAEVSGARATYRKVRVDRLGLLCLGAVGTPAEKALDEYIEAANTWRECRADAGCGTYTIEPRLQRKWRVASHFIARAHAGHV